MVINKKYELQFNFFVCSWIDVKWSKDSGDWEMRLSNKQMEVKSIFGNVGGYMSGPTSNGMTQDPSDRESVLGHGWSVPISKCVAIRDESVATDSFTTNKSRMWTTRTGSPKQEELVLWFFFFNIKQKYGHVNKIYKRIELRLAAILYWLSLQRSQRFSQWEVAMVLPWHLGKQMTRRYRWICTLSLSDVSWCLSLSSTWGHSYIPLHFWK